LCIAFFVFSKPAFATDDGRWVNLNLSNHPRARTEFSAIYDTDRRRMVIFGGVGRNLADTSDSTLEDVWALNLDSSPAAWYKLNVSGQAPEDKSDYAAAYDQTYHRMVIFGGEHHVHNQQTGDEVSSKVTYLTFTGDTTASWADATPAASPPNYPCGRSGAGAFWNSGRLMVFGGAYRIGGSPTELQDLWALTLPASGPGVWTQLSPRDHCKDHNQHNVCSCWDDNFGTDFCDSSIAQVGINGDSTCAPQTCRIPDRRQYFASAYDATNSRWIIHGGWYEVTPQEVVGTYAWSQSSTTNCWSAITESGAEARWNHKAIYHPGRQTVVFFGGKSGEGSFVYYNDTWEITSNGTFRQLAVGTTLPSPREYCAAVYDPTCDRMVIFGGNNSSGNPLGDTWALYFGTDTSAPGAVSDLYPAAGNHTVTVGWTAPTDDSPSEAAKEYDLRYSLSAIADSNFANATRAVIPAPAAPGESEVAVISGLASCTTYYVALKSRDESCNWSAISNVVSKKTLGCGPHDASHDVVEVPRTLELLAPQPNPIRSSVTFEGRIPPSMVGSRVVLVAFDALGRRIRTLYSGSAPVGSLKQIWDLKNEAGERVRSGVYFARLSVGSEVRTRTILVQSDN